MDNTSLGRLSLKEMLARSQCVSCTEELLESLLLKTGAVLTDSYIHGGCVSQVCHTKILIHNRIAVTDQRQANKRVLICASDHTKRSYKSA